MMKLCAAYAKFAAISFASGQLNESLITPATWIATSLPILRWFASLLLRCTRSLMIDWKSGRSDLV